MSKALQVFAAPPKKQQGKCQPKTPTQCKQAKPSQPSPATKANKVSHTN